MGLQTPSYDEAWATPTEEAVMVAVRTQQVIRYESGVPRVADPFAGSYYVEWLTSKLEEAIEEKAELIESKGGWKEVLQSGWVHTELQRNLLEMQNKVESGERPVVGVNKFAIPPEEDLKPKVYAPDRSEVAQYISEFKEFKRNRDHMKLKETLNNLHHAAAKTEDNLLPYTNEALKANATFEEISGVLREVDGLDYDWAGEREYPFS